MQTVHIKRSSKGQRNIKERIIGTDHIVLQHNKSLTPAVKPNTRRRKKERFKLQTAAALRHRQMALRHPNAHISPARASFKSLSRLHYLYCTYVYTCTIHISVLVHTCCNAANPSCCNNQLMGGGRMVASSTFRLLSTNSYTQRRNLEQGLRARSKLRSDTYVLTIVLVKNLYISKGMSPA